TYANIKASGQRRRRLVLGTMACLLLLFLPWPLTISTEFHVAPTSNADVRAEVSGFVEAVYVREGQRVEKGQLLARIREADLRAEIEKLENVVAEKEARLRLLRAGASREAIELLRREVETARTRQDHSRQQLEQAQRLHAQRLRKASSSVEKATSRLQYARQELSRAEALHTQGMISQKKYEEALEQRAVRERELEEAQADLALFEAETFAEHRRDLAVATRQYQEAESRLAELLAGARPEELEAAEAELAKFQVELQYQKDQLGRTRLLSPEAGMVVTPKVEDKVGQFVERGELICEVFDYGRVRAEMAVPEKELADVAVGQKVVLKARGFPGETFRGRLTAISPRVSEEEIENVAVAYTEVENPDLKLRPGMTGHAKIYAGQRPLGAVLLRRLLRTVRVEFWSWL
ncbi:MAG: HlyD family secretion protein, partial [Terriglobia bacterium]